MKSYEQMLEEGLKSLPEGAVVTKRFEIPNVKGHIQGNKTFITNFNQILDSLRRDRDHFLKYLFRELAARGDFDGPRLVLNRKVSAVLINQKIDQYSKLYVLCSSCGKPDTQILENEGITYLKCNACGDQKKITL